MLAVAALSARMLVEAAALDGLRTVALDLFGDADTQRLAARWRAIGEPATMRVDDRRLLGALRELAGAGEVRGWIAGSGFEGRPELLARGAAMLPLIGTAPSDWQRIRDPHEFFAVLRAYGIGFPAVAFEPPAVTAGWLSKDAGGCGGWQVRRASPNDRGGAGRYWQRERRGLPMSATFVGTGRDAVLLGVNRQLTRLVGGRPFVFCGVIGPLPVSDALRRDLTSIVQLLAGAFQVRGLASLDFLLDGDTVEVLELNPRPPASLLLYPRVGARGPLGAHLLACEQGELPPAPAQEGKVRGTEIVFATQAVQIGEARASRIAGIEGTRDLPRAGTQCAAGDPLCSLVAEGRDEDDTRRQLAHRREALQAALETTT
ncbi:ATP-grasp domain-containing protein [uncultured Piscinibacter sp.]|uniref:ATP-grasp domain-containing protein n=1 Tax=uncultured Piscinibacter sp. TaxID=1131835 RepID=UPI00261A22A4|nr:ATP-grasp domain-containing protein [uncultured Piscinibacter sp.]